ncbi:expressed unknown protein [Seminavis robusta]|uniref:Uncharacterized protein n=1 Tax=Seminavis robusta TaxID=568900 RepID=A0A9N8EBS1_9STRA|nr:expressed unknown protein [Seminavis robusta]|eukprot:Sro777_g201060.1 n/a (235) ;mRNA; r:36717-37421
MKSLIGSKNFMCSQHKAKRTHSDDASLSLSSWAGLDVSPDHQKSADRIVHSRSNSANKRSHRKPEPVESNDNASISPSISSWGCIDTDRAGGERLHSSDSNIDYYTHCDTHPSSFDISTKQVDNGWSKPIHSRDSSWGNMDVEFMGNIAEQRERVARGLLEQHRSRKMKTPIGGTETKRKPPLRSSSKTQTTLLSKPPRWTQGGGVTVSKRNKRQGEGSRINARSFVVGRNTAH